ncbi:MAG: NUDIX domain-containing protein, partial [Bacteroidetes bacterium]|nr:NUDIX domain-containing protein [Bacteroidota bacterium]
MKHMPKHYDTILQNRSQGFRAGALVIKDTKVLLMHQIFNGEDFYTLPGGTWEKGETIEETCKREVLEEFGINVTVGKLAFLIDTETRIAF